MGCSPSTDDVAPKMNLRRQHNSQADATLLLILNNWIRKCNDTLFLYDDVATVIINKYLYQRIFEIDFTKYYTRSRNSYDYTFNIAVIGGLSRQLFLRCKSGYNGHKYRIVKFDGLAVRLNLFKPISNRHVQLRQPTF